MNIKDFYQQFASSDWPECRDAQVSETLCTLTLYIHSRIRWFEGHFPQQPILAGVVQTHWAAEFGKFLFNINNDVVRIDNLKFQSVIVPEQELQLMLEYLPSTGALKFSYRADELHFSEGKFVFGVSSALQEHEEVADK